MFLRTFMAAGVLLAASTTSAAPPAEQVASDDVPAANAAPATAAQTEADAESERKICRTEKATGSLTRRTRICLTAAQWREVNDRTRRGVDEMNSSASGGKMCVPDPADPFQGCS